MHKESQPHKTGDSLCIKVMENLVILKRKSMGTPRGECKRQRQSKSSDFLSSIPLLSHCYY